MKIEQIYTGCLAQGAYYIESNGEIAIIDPLREVKPYLDRAKRDGGSIKYIFETHFHADFVSGHVSLSKETGAPIIFGPNAKTNFDSIVATDGQEFTLGKITIKVLHTPGHTMESSCFLLIDENGKNHSLFSGDTLFLGDVGRPDLAQKTGELTEKDLAGYLYDSLRSKIMILEDDITVYPAHGAGSACGKNLSSETQDTLGNQKKTNYALRADMTKEEFIEEVTDGLLPPPKYFPQNVKMNKEGYKDIDQVMQQGSTALSPDEFEQIANQQGALVLDVRTPDEYEKGHIPRSIFIGLDGSFAPWVGAMIADVKQPIILVTPEGREDEAVLRLSRVGFDVTLGYLKGGFDSWKNSGKEIDTVDSISAVEFENSTSKDKTVVDVRKNNEYISEHVLDAVNIPLDFINENLSKYPVNNPFFIHCAGGYRSMIAASILKSRGIHNLTNIKGGFKAIKDTSVQVSEFVCPSTL